VGTQTTSIEFTLGGLPVRLARVDERWIARVGESVAIGCSARQVIRAALEPIGEARRRVLLADTALLEPSLAVARLEAAGRPA